MPGLEINDHWRNIQKVLRKRKWDLKVEFDSTFSYSRDFTVVQRLRLACQFRGHRFDPWSRKIPHAVGQLSPRATTIVPESRACVP